MKQGLRIAMMKQHNEAVKELKDEKVVLQEFPMHDEATCDREEFCLYTILRGLVSGTPTAFQAEVAGIMLANLIRDVGREAAAGRVGQVVVLVMPPAEKEPEGEGGGGGSIH